MDIVKWLHDEARCGFSNSKKLKEAADEIEQLRHIATFLFDVLDDIDTASDEAKNDDAWYRKRVQHLHKKRFEVMTTDGFNVFPRSALQQKDTE